MSLINTARIPWVQLRGEVLLGTDDTFLTSFDYGDWDASKGISLKTAPLQDASGLVIAMHGSNAADEETAYEIYGRTRMNGPIQLLLKGIATLGTQNATEDPITKATIANGEWVDTITVTGGIFKDRVTILDSGNNRICELIFDQTHIEDIACYFKLDGGSGADSAAMYAIISGW